MNSLAPPKRAGKRATTQSGDVDIAKMLAWYETMQVIRKVEERLAALFADGQIPGFIHLSVGQEAVAAGVILELNEGDTVASNHRGHGHALAKGVDLERFFLEILGKDGGCCRGRGGSMHVADLRVGMLGANEIVGGGLSLAVGAGLAHQINKTGMASVVFFGDGALASGAVHECFNLATLWKLPILFVCENNGWSEFSPTSRQFVAPVAAIAAAFGLPSLSVDGNDVAAVSLATTDLLGRVRAGSGPAVLECNTRRIRGHFEGDAQKYRQAHEAPAVPESDPIARIRTRLVNSGRGKVLSEIDARLDLSIEAAVERARAGEPPMFGDALRDVYSPPSVILGAAQ